MRWKAIAADQQNELDSRPDMHHDETVCGGVVGNTQPAQLRSPISSLFGKRRKRPKQAVQYLRNADAVARDLLLGSPFHSLSSFNHDCEPRSFHCFADGRSAERRERFAQ